MPAARRYSGTDSFSPKHLPLEDPCLVCQVNGSRGYNVRFEVQEFSAALMSTRCNFRQLFKKGTV